MELYGNTKKKKKPWCPRNLNIRHTEITKAMENVDNKKQASSNIHTLNIYMYTDKHTQTPFFSISYEVLVSQSICHIL